LKKAAGVSCLLAVIMGTWGMAGSRGAAIDISGWSEELRQALVSGKGLNLERFFTPDAFEREMQAWKYSLKNGFLNFSGTEVTPLSDQAIWLHIPTDDRPYSWDNDDDYFDFIYRIYEIKRSGASFRIVRRIEDAFNPDFLHVRSRIEIRPREQMFLIESTTTADLRNNRLVFKLAKEFEIGEFTINGQKTPYKRLGYFVQAVWDQGTRVVFTVKGKLPVPRDNNQFFSMDENCFFLRSGGFAAIPSPPPATGGEYLFSHDQTSFETTYVYPKEFPFLQYGRVLDEKIIGAQKVVTTSDEGEWMDNLAFYGQRDWSPYAIREGKARLVFYFPGKDRNVQEFMAKEIRRLFDWSYRVFKAYPESEVNFVVLDRFYRNGALNDGHSVVTQDAQTQADDSYIHELLHTVPQPKMREDFLWRKEGFTNFLSMDFIDFRSGQEEYWKGQKRRLLHAFDLYSEPLAALVSTRMPTSRAAYDKGPWVYRMLSAVIGESNFRKAMLEFATMKGRVLAGPRDYFKIFERISGQELSWFEDQWLTRKENPVLRIESSSETSVRGDQIKLKITQEGRIFRLPLDVEIKCRKGAIRKTIWLNSAVQEFSIPVQSPVSSIRFDPEARLFAILKTGRTSFLNPKETALPMKAAVYRYTSNSGGRDVEYRIIPGEEKVTFIKKEKGWEASLELSSALSPSTYKVNGAAVYAWDPAAGKIAFSDAAYDTAEPVYPEDFIGLLFSCVDWTKSSAQSLLFLRDGQKRCAGASAEREKGSGRDVKLKIDFYAGTMEMTIRNGVPVEYTIDGKEKFILMDR
jgi:hypothetical protein